MTPVNESTSPQQQQTQSNETSELKVRFAGGAAGHETDTSSDADHVPAQSGKRAYDHVYTESEVAELNQQLIDIFYVIVSLVCGFVFGFVIEKGRVFEPRYIRLQMVFAKFVMLKMFLSAMVVGMIVLAVLHLLPIRSIQWQVSNAVKGTMSFMEGKNVLSLIFGPFLLGIGMTFSGACPGMVFPQFGAGTKFAWCTLLGALFGNLFYGLWHDRLYGKLFPKNRLSLPITRLPIRRPFWYVLWTLPMILLVVLGLIGLEVLVPWKSEISDLVNYAPTVLKMYAWPPLVSGSVIGLLQLPLLLFGHTLSGSGAFNTVCAFLMLTDGLRKKFPYLGAKRKLTVGAWWQVLFVIGSTVGGVVSSTLSNTWGTAAGVPPHYALIGGALMLFGARIACGCTSGHGLSGSSLLFLGSFIAVPCMFAGGISTAFIMQTAGELDNFVS